MCAMQRVVVVLPLVPVTATTGMRPLSVGPNSVETMASPTGRDLPADGSICIRNPGPALTSTTTPPCSSSGRPMSDATTSMPAMSRPNDARRFDGTSGDLRMNAVRDVGRGAARAQVSVAANEDSCTLGRHSVRATSLARPARPRQSRRCASCSSSWRDRLHVVDRHSRRRPAAPRCARHRPLTCAGSRRAAAINFAADHQQPVIVPRREAFHEDCRFFGTGRLVSLDHLGTGGQIRRHAPPLVAVLRLDDDRAADFFCRAARRPPRLRRAFRTAPAPRRSAAAAASTPCLARSSRRWRWSDRSRQSTHGALAPPIPVAPGCQYSAGASGSRARWAASTIERVLGPSCTSCSSERSCVTSE